MRRRGKFGIALSALMIATVTLAAIRYWPRAPLAARIPSSTAVLDSQGQLLRLTLAADQQYRIWTPLESISPQLVEALLLHEDRHFYFHPGVNPYALFRAAFATYTGGARQGGSTLSMQLARLLYGINTRTVGGKCRQIVLALGLELRYSKRELLEAHLNLLPFGGNLQGVGTASRVYFGKSADRLVLSEALSLVVIPQSPLRRAPSDEEPATLRYARERLFARWLAVHPEDANESSLVSLPLRYAGLEKLPFVAPHFTSLLLARYPEREIRSTLDRPLQQLSEQVVGHFIRERSQFGVRNAAALLVDYRDMSVRAMVGSADFFAGEIDGQVNGTVAKRSPGSALKPFIYALAIDQGLIHPLTVLKDAPTAFGSFTPENFDGRFVGPLTATDALTRSRNVPAVALASQLTQPSLYQFLRTAGVSKMASERHYGLALALGGGEITMEETAMLYAVLANRGTLAPLRYRTTDALSDGTRVLSEEASFMTVAMLKSAPRPDGNQWSPSMRRDASQTIAWKTGTSWGFRDAWTVGIVGPYVLAVWVGNFDGSSNPAFVGVETAAPLFFRLTDALFVREPALREPKRLPPDRLVKVEVCSASGDLPNAECPRTATTWYIPGVSPLRVSDIHRRIWIDTRTGKQACAPYDPAFTRSEVFEFWPSDVRRLFAQAGMSRRAPPEAIDCHRDIQTGTPPQITSPLTHVTYTLRANEADRNFVPLAASAYGDVRRVHWFVDDTYVGTSPPSEAIAWRTTQSGRHIVRAVDDQGRADARELYIAFSR